MSRSPQRYPRYLTFRDGELDERLRAAARLAPGEPMPPLRARNGRPKPVKEHSFAVAYPDGTEGACAYERGGPSWHIFKFRYGEANELLPVQYLTRPIDGCGTEAIEAASKGLAADAFRAAADRERKEVFQRASDPQDGPAVAGDPPKAQPQMDAKKAKEQAGRYAVCLRLPSGTLLPVGSGFDPSWDGLLAANEAWRKTGGKGRLDDRLRLAPLVVGCCHRRQRAWRLPRFNPLYAETGPRFGGEPDPTPGKEIPDAAAG